MPNNTIEELDASLAQKYNLDELFGSTDKGEQEDSEDVLEELDSNTTDDATDDGSEDVGENTEDTNDDAGQADENSDADDDETKPSKKPSKSEKQNFAFAQLRRERDEALSKLANKENDDLIAKLAEANGYSDPSKYKEAIEAELVRREASKRGADPEQYIREKNLEKRISELETKEANQQKYSKLTDFQNSMSKFIKELSLGADGEDVILEELEKSGFKDIDEVLRVPNFDVLLKGVLSDKLQDKAIQAQIKNKKKVEEIADEKLDGTTASTNWRTSLTKELEEYGKERGLI